MSVDQSIRASVWSYAYFCSDMSELKFVSCRFCPNFRTIFDMLNVHIHTKFKLLLGRFLYDTLTRPLWRFILIFHIPCLVWKSAYKTNLTCTGIYTQKIRRISSFSPKESWNMYEEILCICCLCVCVCVCVCIYIYIYIYISMLVRGFFFDTLIYSQSE